MPVISLLITWDLRLLAHKIIFRHCIQAKGLSPVVSLTCAIPSVYDRNLLWHRSHWKCFSPFLVLIEAYSGHPHDYTMCHITPITYGIHHKHQESSEYWKKLEYKKFSEYWKNMMQKLRDLKKKFISSMFSSDQGFGII